ncbi:glycosyltransferase 87 family protein [Solwaraspora sp. WMMD1047]|uniref:glycosyltransferase 87 family protein n=1 Tax=Solwaraspora sp. WMMD1047 TaxID=3016102 RepID=UPI002416ED52|nr:glycosyltransferase 87 family protein [Solwaraspora sp. WMMD1047]MDG4834771.1 glycosyltransferase 87 family protein [Solwaraspora sp. WMMD1047]
MRTWNRADRAAGGLAADLLLYLLAAAFAAATAATSTLLPHRAWGAVAAFGYLAAALAATGQLLARRHRPDSPLAGTPARTALVALTWAGTALLPLVWQSTQRAAGHPARAQEEVVVIEDSGRRLLDDGTPYLGLDAITALPPDERLLGYNPYQPGMALFGLPRAAAGDVWWTDARLWFALATAAALLLAVATLRRARTAPAAGTAQAAQRDAALVRAGQFATVLPVCALTLATGGDDLPVLACCLLALALAASRRFGAAGLAIGVAAALKLLAWPVALVLLVHAATAGRRALGLLAAGALGLPAAALLPALLVDPAALVENVVKFPLGQGIVTSPAQSPFPGYLIASNLPGGRAIAAALLVGTAIAIAVGLARRPPRTAASVALFCGYGLLAAILLMPATRFGYLLYPAALLAWVPALRLATEPATGTAAEPAARPDGRTPGEGHAVAPGQPAR